jgi:16S rRNA (cytosine967-C5)-methyltransferase
MATLHRPIAEQVVIALRDTFGEGYQADKVIERLFKRNKKLGARDRRFIAETTYDLIRNWRYLWVTLGASEPDLEHDPLMRLLGAWLLLRDDQMTTLPAWPEFSGLDRGRLLRSSERARESVAVRESVPDWLYEHGKKEMGDSWDAVLHALNEPAPVCMRANRLKTTREELIKVLAKEEIFAHIAPETEDGIILDERKNVFTSAAFKAGLFEIQDGASQQVAPLVDAKPGDRVIDACAGGGGKTLHLAAQMKNKGKIIAMDVSERKLQSLRVRCTRAGVDIAEVRVIESMKSIKRLEKTADRVLLDVPCTGLGVLRRNPDKKWKITPEEIDRLHLLQAEILENYSAMVKPGGRLVYATCSCLPSENEKQIETFLQAHPDTWELLTEKKFQPGENGYDGFYAAALVRCETPKLPV